MSSSEFSASDQITHAVQSLILSQASTFVDDIKNGHISIIKWLKSSQAASPHSDLLDRAPSSLKRSVELASGKGISSWLTVLPWQEHGFALHKTGVHDAITIRYGWYPTRVPQHCPCGAWFTIGHLFLVQKGTFHRYDIMRFDGF